MSNYLTKLSGQNMQGQTFTDELYPVTLICGDNARGKTTRINAIHLALAAYAPGVSKKGCDIFAAFATGNPLVTEAWFKECYHVGNSWTERGGSVRAEDIGNGQCKMPPVMLDADEYFGLSGPEKTRFIFSRAKLPAELTIVNITNSLSANVKNITLEENTAESQAAIAEVAELIVGAGFEAGHQTPQDFVAQLAEDLRKRKNLADQNVKRLEKTVQGLAQVRETAAAAPQDAEVRLTEARTALDVANADVARLLEAGKTLRRQLDEVEALAGKAVAEGDARKKLAELADEKERLLNATKNGASNVLETAAERKAVQELNRVGGIKNLADAELRRIAGELEHAKSEKTCSACGQSTVKIKKKIIAALQKEHALAVTASNQAAKDYIFADKAYDAAEVFLKAANKRVEDFNRDSVALNGVITGMSNLQTSLMAGSAAAEAKSKLPKLQADVAQAREQYNAAVTIAGEKKSAVTTAEASYKLLLQERSTASSRASVIAESVKAKAELAVLKQAVEMVLELQTKLVEAAVGPIVAACNRLCGCVLKYPLAYRDGEIGMAAPEGFVTKLLSGAEKALTRCAVSLALASEADFKLAIIDEMGRLSARNKKLMVANVIKLVKSVEIHQVVLVDTDADDYEPFEREFKDLFGVIRI